MSAAAAPARAVLKQGTKLSNLVAHLDAKPRLGLAGVKSLKLSYAFRNDHFGARHFVKEDLPRIRWANPNLDIQVERAQKTASEQWRPELVVAFTDGRSTTLNLQDKFSKSILSELMETAGDKSWKEYKTLQANSGEPLFPSTSIKRKIPAAEAEKLPSLQTFRDSNPESVAATGKLPSRPKKETIPEPAKTEAEASAPS
ncbi:hypothetical protein MD484_g4752, partial [Candolleomyces efflorescens]